MVLMVIGISRIYANPCCTLYDASDKKKTVKVSLKLTYGKDTQENTRVFLRVEYISGKKQFPTQSDFEEIFSLIKEKGLIRPIFIKKLNEDNLNVTGEFVGILKYNEERVFNSVLEYMSNVIYKRQIIKTDFSSHEIF